MSANKLSGKYLRRKLVSFLSIFITGVLCLLAIIYSTPWGAQASIALLNKLTGITITYDSGMFSKDIALSNFSYKNQHVDINAQNITLQFHLRCIWRKQLCVDTLTLDKLSIKVEPSTTQPATQITDIQNNQLVTLPFSIKAKSISVNTIDITFSNYALTVKDFHSPINIKQHNFTFNQPSIERLNIALQANEHKQAAITVAPTTTQNVNLKLPNFKLPNIKLPLALGINQLSLNYLTLSHKPLNDLAPNLPTTLTHLQLSAHWFEHALTINELATHYGIGAAKLKGEVSFINNNYPLSIQFNNALHSNTFWPEINDSTQNISLTGNLSDLALQLSSSGTLALTGEAKLNALNKALPYRMNINATEIPLYNQISQHLHPSQLSVVSHGNMNSHTITANSMLNGLGYHNANTVLDAHYSRLPQHTHNINEQEATSAWHTLTINNFTLKDANNDLAITGLLKLEDDPSWQLAIKSSGFTFPQLQHANSQYPEWLVGNVKGTLNTQGIYNNASSQISLSNTQLSGNINHIPFNVSGNIALNEQLVLSPSAFDLSVFNAKMHIEGESNQKWNVQGHINIPQIEQFTPEITGSVATQFTISGPLKQPKISFNHKLSHVSFNNIVATLVNAKGTYAPFSQHKTNTHITSKHIRVLDTDLINFAGHISGDTVQQSVDIKWEGNVKSKLLLNSHWNTKTQRWVGIIAGAEFNYLTHKWQPDSDIIIGYNQQTQQLSLNKHCWNTDGLNICLPQNVSFFDSGNIPLSLTFNSYYFNKTFAPKDISVNTNIKGNANIHWSPDIPHTIKGDLFVLAGNVLLEEKEIYLPVKVLSAWDEGHLTFTLNKHLAKARMTLSPSEQNDIRHNYDFYSDINLQGQVNFEQNLPLTAQVNIDNFNLRPLQAINHELTLLDGSLSTRVKVNGNFKQPNVYGKIQLTKGSAKLLKSPTLVDDVKIQLDLLGKKADIKGTFAVGNDTGYIEGDAAWEHERTLDLAINAEQLSFLIPPQVKATIAPKLHASLTKNNLHITGKVDVIKGELEVTELPEGSVELTNDVIFVNEQGDKIIKDTPFNITSDIEVFINDVFKLSGQGFDGHLAGVLRVQHNNQQPLQLFGHLNIPDGRYHAYGQRLQIERGKVAFTGPLDNPHIDLKATRTIAKENIKVGVEITGFANALSLNLTSSPSLSRAQTLSYLLRGQRLENDAPDNSGIGVALGAALANYSGILKKIDKLPLINNVEIDGDSTQVSIAGYLGKRIYVKYGIGVEEPVNELTIRLFLMSRLWIETISGLENSADIYYSFDSD